MELIAATLVHKIVKLVKDIQIIVLRAEMMIS